MNKKVFRRLDVFESDLGDVQRTEEGFAHFFARATRTGVFLYKNQDGSLRRELRLPEEVFSIDSMATLKNKPVTNDHPTELVDSKNARDYTVGMTGEDVTQDDIYLKTKVVLTDDSTIIEVIENGKVEVSCGYTCEHEIKSGTFEGENYDLIQRNIRYNHLAVVDVGRAGPEVKLRLDKGDAIMIKKTKKDQLSHNDIRDQLAALIRKETIDDAWVYVRDIIGNEVIYEVDGQGAGLYKEEFSIIDDKITLTGNKTEVKEITSFKVLDQLKKYQKEDKKMEKIIIDGVEQEVSLEFKNAYDARAKNNDGEDVVKQKDSEISKLQAKVDSLEADAKKGDPEDEKTKMDEAVNERVKTRLKLYDAAKARCDEEIIEELDGMSETEIKKAVIKTTLKEDSVINIDEKDETYIDTRFDIVMENETVENADSDTVVGGAIVVNRTVKRDVSANDDKLNNWREPLAMSKSVSIKNQGGI